MLDDETEREWDIVKPSLAERLFEAAMDSAGLRLTAKDVQRLVAMEAVDTWITDRAMEEASGGTPGTLLRGLVQCEDRELETWNEFKRRVRATSRRPLEFKHKVPRRDAEDSELMTITIIPESGGLAVHLEGTGVCEMDNAAPVYVEFWDDAPRLVMWPDINNPDATVVDLSGALESKRLPDMDTAQESDSDG